MAICSSHAPLPKGHRAFTVQIGTVDPNDSNTWGWVPRKNHKYHDDWYLAFQYNTFEGFFYIGDYFPPISGNYPTTGWTFGQTTDWTRTISISAGKEKYLPIKIIQDLPITYLRWVNPALLQLDADIEWKPNQSISGIELQPPPLLTWSPNVADDGEYSIEYNKTANTLKLHDGAAQAVVNGINTLTSSSPAGSIKVYVTVNDLPTVNATGTVRIVPARTPASVP
jgi:hypothetical protein